MHYVVFDLETQHSAAEVGGWHRAEVMKISCIVLYDCLGFRVSLAALAASTLGESKTADGPQALRWWQQGRIGDIIEYCRQDVRVTRDLYRFGRDNGHLVYRDKSRNDRFTIAVDWK